MTKPDNQKNNKHILLLIGLGMYLAFSLTIWFFILNVPNWFLIEKKDFKSYETFRKKTSDFYPDTIPNEETNDIRYYYLKGHYNNISAVSFIVDEKTYDEIKNKYDDFFCHDDWSYDFIARYQPLTEDIIKKDELKFITSFIPDVNSYEIWHMYISNHLHQGAGHNYTYGVFYNEKDNRILIFDFDEGINLWGNPFVR